jgi:hypothetical protein
MSRKVYYEKTHETQFWLGFMLTKGLVDVVTFQKLNAELYMDEYTDEAKVSKMLVYIV